MEIEFTDEELKELEKQGLTDTSGKPVEGLIRLDMTTEIATSRCVHEIVEDEVNHWVCNKCGLGKYLPPPWC